MILTMDLIYQSDQTELAKQLRFLRFKIKNPIKAHIPNIHALNSDTHTLRIQYEYTQKQCVGVAIEGIDIWYMGLIK